MLPHTLTSRPLIVPDHTTISVGWDSRVKAFGDGRLINDYSAGKGNFRAAFTKQSGAAPDFRQLGAFLLLAVDARHGHQGKQWQQNRHGADQRPARHPGPELFIFDLGKQN